MTSSSSNTKTDTKQEIRPSVVTAVKAYVAAESAAQSKYWLLLFEGIEMIEVGFDRREILRQFSTAYCQTAKIKLTDFQSAPAHVNSRMMFGKVADIIFKLSADEIKKHQRKNGGFWALYARTKSPPKSSARPKEKVSKETLEAEADEGVANADTYAKAHTTTSTTPKTVDEIANRCQAIYKQHRSAFYEVLQRLVAYAILPDDVLKITQDYWNDR